VLENVYRFFVDKTVDNEIGQSFGVSSAVQTPPFFNTSSSLGLTLGSGDEIGVGTYQGCQICQDSIYQNGEKILKYHKITKLPQNIPNDHKIYQMTTKYTK
jgi:hypothetical protein